MPPEPSSSRSKSKRTNPSRRLGPVVSSGTGEFNTELELKRKRGEVACSECRRLKIKCDKQIPCQSCQRRGCAALCPNGSLATGQGTRFVLAATEHLHRRIARMNDRIRALEEALATEHSHTSPDPHPLLNEQLLSGNGADDDDFDSDGLVAPAVAATEPDEKSDIADAFGTLSISDYGISKFFGPTGGSERLLERASIQVPSSPNSAHSSPASNSANELFSPSFPLTPLSSPAQNLTLIYSYLPPYTRALQLCQTYFLNPGWLIRCIDSEQIFGNNQEEGLLRDVYKQRDAPRNETDEDLSSGDIGPHDLALLFIILSLATLATSEVDQSKAESEAEHFQQITRAALSLQSVLEKPSLGTVQTLFLLSIYHGMVSSESEETRSLVTLAAHLSMTIGLHRDSARWGLPSHLVQRRRALFWDIFNVDIWQSIKTGRPPSFSLTYVDCGYPDETLTDSYVKAEHDTNSSNNEDSFSLWLYKFASECISDITSQILTAKVPNYSIITDLDKKVREFPVPSSFAPRDSATANSSPEDMKRSFQMFVVAHIKEIALIYIHRSFFAVTLTSHPTNPLKSPYAASFLATYRSSATVLKCISEQFKLYPKECERQWQMWGFAFGAAIVFGTVVTRGPQCPLAKPAMTELEQACSLFEKASINCKKASQALPILHHLEKKARVALQTGMSVDVLTVVSRVTNEDDEDDDELSILAGRTRFVGMRSNSRLSGTTDNQPITLVDTTGSTVPSFDFALSQNWEQEMYIMPNPGSGVEYNYLYDRSRQPPPPDWQQQTPNMYNPPQTSALHGQHHQSHPANQGYIPQSDAWGITPPQHPQ